jgi:hypothetical protein
MFSKLNYNTIIKFVLPNYLNILKLFHITMKHALNILNIDDNILTYFQIKN